MTGDVVNLRQARKHKARRDKEEVAERNRFEHGRTKAERELARVRKAADLRKHESGRILKTESSSDTDG